MGSYSHHKMGGTKLRRKHLPGSGTHVQGSLEDTASALQNGIFHHLSMVVWWFRVPQQQYPVILRGWGQIWSLSPILCSAKSNWVKQMELLRIFCWILITHINRSRSPQIDRGVITVLMMMLMMIMIMMGIYLSNLDPITKFIRRINR